MRLALARIARFLAALTAAASLGLSPAVAGDHAPARPGAARTFSIAALPPLEQGRFATQLNRLLKEVASPPGSVPDPSRLVSCLGPRAADDSAAPEEVRALKAILGMAGGHEGFLPIVAELRELERRSPGAAGAAAEGLAALGSAYASEASARPSLARALALSRSSFPDLGAVFDGLESRAGLDADPAVVISKVPRPGLAPGLRYAGRDWRHPLSFGLEVEMFLQESPRILDDYRLQDVDEARWSKLSLEEKIKAVRSRSRQLGHGVPFLRKRPSAPAELPDTLVSEVTSDLEMNGVVFGSLDELKAYVRFLVARYGAASFQGHVVFGHYDRVDGLAGYLLFEADRAQLKALEFGYRRHRDAGAVPGRNLSHPHLGPLDESARRFYLLSEARIAAGRPIGEKRQRSLKGQAPLMRDVIYPGGHKGVEFRQFHKRHEELLDEMDEFSGLLEASRRLARFKIFEGIPLISPGLPAFQAGRLGIPFDEKPWTDFFARVGDFLRRRSSLWDGTPAEQRYLYPLRDWRNHPLVLELPDGQRRAVQDRIEESTSGFLAAVAGLAERGEGSPIDQAVIEGLQAAAARWAYQADMAGLFEEYKTAVLAAHGPRGPPAAAEELELPYQAKTFGDGRPYRRYKMSAILDAQSPAYAAFRDATIEVIYDELVPRLQGHFMLRVGGRIYGLSGRYALNAPFALDRLRRRGLKRFVLARTGFVFEVGAARIRAVQAELDALYRAPAEANVPPFDLYGLRLEIVRGPDGGPRYKSDTSWARSHPAVGAELVEKDGALHLETRDGFRYPVFQEDGRLYVQGYSCASIVVYALKDYFSIDTLSTAYSTRLAKSLREGNLGGKAPQAIIEY